MEKPGRISKDESNKVKMQLNKVKEKAIDFLKNALVSREVILLYSNFDKEFHLTKKRFMRQMRGKCWP